MASGPKRPPGCALIEGQADEGDVGLQPLYVGAQRGFKEAPRLGFDYGPFVLLLRVGPASQRF